MGVINVNSPFGFQPINLLPNGIHRYYKDATAGIIAVGDPVIRGTNSSDPQGYPEIVRATTGAAITGVVIAVEPVRSNLNQSGYLLAADLGYVLVADHPDQEFIVRENGGATGIVITNIGQHVDSVAAINANTVTGRSNYALDTEAIAADNTWRIERKYDQDGNDVQAYAVWVVKPNLHTESNASATKLTEI
jgi:hypothetical protein